MAATSNDRAVEEVFEEGEAPKQAQSIHRIRANSTIMQLSKILGESIPGCKGSTVDLGSVRYVRVQKSDMWKHCMMWWDSTTGG